MCKASGVVRDAGKDRPPMRFAGIAAKTGGRAAAKRKRPGYAAEGGFKETGPLMAVTAKALTARAGGNGRTGPLGAKEKAAVPVLIKAAGPGGQKPGEGGGLSRRRIRRCFFIA